MSGAIVALLRRQVTAPVVETSPGISIATTASAVSGAQGAVVYRVFTLTRTGGHSADVAFAVAGLPSGVTGAFSDVTLSGAESTTTLSLTVDGAASLVSADAFTVTATSAGVDEAVVACTMTVTAESGDTPDWDDVRDFNSGSPGDSGQSADGFDDAAGSAVKSTVVSFDGTKCCVTSIGIGEDGFGNWGGIIYLLGELTKGDALWSQIEFNLETGFEISTPTNGSLKFLRWHIKTAAGAHVGYIDIQLMDDFQEGGAPQGYSFRMLQEAHGVWRYFGAPSLVTRATNHKLTAHIVLDNVLQAGGGNARIRVWLNDVLLVDDATVKTLDSATDRIDNEYVLTYWNDGAPRSQSMRLDNIRNAKNGTPTWALSLEGVA
jgi:hypothetical protein